MRICIIIYAMYVKHYIIIDNMLKIKMCVDDKFECNTGPINVMRCVNFSPSVSVSFSYIHKFCFIFSFNINLEQFYLLHYA